MLILLLKVICSGQEERLLYKLINEIMTREHFSFQRKKYKNSNKKKIKKTLLNFIIIKNILNFKEIYIFQIMHLKKSQSMRAFTF